MSVAFSRLGNGSTTAGCRRGGALGWTRRSSGITGETTEWYEGRAEAEGNHGISYWCGDSLRTDGEGKKASHLHRAAGAPTFAPLELHHPVIKVRTWVIRTD